MYFVYALTGENNYSVYSMLNSDIDKRIHAYKLFVIRILSFSLK